MAHPDPAQPSAGVCRLYASQVDQVLTLGEDGQDEPLQPHMLHLQQGTSLSACTTVCCNVRSAVEAAASSMSFLPLKMLQHLMSECSQRAMESNK